MTTKRPKVPVQAPDCSAVSAPGALAVLFTLSKKLLKPTKNQHFRFSAPTGRHLDDEIRRSPTIMQRNPTNIQRFLTGIVVPMKSVEASGV